MTGPQSADVEYLGMCPGLSSGVGIAITTFRPRNQPGWNHINVNLKRASLERLRDDIIQVLAESKLLNNEVTLADAEQERVEVDADVLEFLGVTGHVYLGTVEDDCP